jgi:transposase
VAAALPLPAGLPLDATSWEQTPLVVHQVVVQLLAVIQQQQAQITALEARMCQNSCNSDRPPSSDPPFVKQSSSSPTKGTPGAKPGRL